MAIEYDLDCATRLPSIALAERLADAGKKTGVFDAAASGQAVVNLRVGVLTRLGTWVCVTASGPLHPRHTIVSGLGFTPTVGVGFRLAKGVEVSAQQDDMIQLVAPLLEEVDGDAVLHCQLEAIWLLRRDGELILSGDDDLWRFQRLALVAPPYRRETFSMVPN
ncbi:SitI3 family protein [Streptomyces sp. NPDC048508]|uniref:SitI3 family protein n=1 Tax=Streptomyces sp. NPDC048508 TaxID=3365561 RepID=UPI003722DC30